MAVRSLKTAGKHLSEMGKEVAKVAEISSAAPLCEKLDEVEQEKCDLEGRLLERVRYYYYHHNTITHFLTHTRSLECDEARKNNLMQKTLLLASSHSRKFLYAKKCVNH